MADDGVVIAQYIIPLIRQRSASKGGNIDYFGPGEDIEKILNSCGDITNNLGIGTEGPERRSGLQRMLSQQYPQIRHRVHIGSTQELVGTNVGRHSNEYVSMKWQYDVERFVWGFDIVHLNKCEFAPVQLGRDVINTLTGDYRQDSWQPWTLVFSFNLLGLSTDDMDALCSFLSRKLGSASSHTSKVIEYLVDSDVSHSDYQARLLHGYTSFIMAEAQNILIAPRPTLIYPGQTRGHMLCIAYELGNSGVACDQQNPLALLRSPILRAREDQESPWFELLPNQPPGQIEDDVRGALDFLPETQSSAIIGGRFT